MAQEWYSCTVNQVGPAADGTDTPPPTVYLMLSDTAGSFNYQWFYAAENSRNQMLAVALAAISLGRHVTAALGVPSPTGLPYPQCYRLYLGD